MTRQTLLGLLFLVGGIVLFLVDLLPTYVAFKTHTAIPLPSFVLLGVAFGSGVFGGWLIPSSGVGPTVTDVTVRLKNTSVPFFGDRRAATQTEATVTVTTPPAELPKDG
jgi:hypothetical protein